MNFRLHKTCQCCGDSIEFPINGTKARCARCGTFHSALLACLDGQPNGHRQVVAIDSKPDIAQLRSILLSASMDRCNYCGTAITCESMDIDHVLPKSRGGSDELQNLKAACRLCNGTKAALTLEQFRELMRRRLADWPYFSPSQRAWLEQHARLPSLPPYKFWFEYLETAGSAQ